VTQGDIVSPIIFSIVVDAIVRKWKENGSTGVGLIDHIVHDQ
jgi:hypothetical protein